MPAAKCQSKRALTHTLSSWVMLFSESLAATNTYSTTTGSGFVITPEERERYFSFGIFLFHMIQIIHRSTLFFIIYENNVIVNA